MSGEVRDLVRAGDWQSSGNIPNLCHIQLCWEKPENYALIGYYVVFLCNKHFHEYLEGCDQQRANERKKA